MAFSDKTAVVTITSTLERYIYTTPVDDEGNIDEQWYELLEWFAHASSKVFQLEVGAKILLINRDFIINIMMDLKDAKHVH